MSSIITIEEDEVEVIEEGPTLPVVLHPHPFASTVRLVAALEGVSIAEIVQRANLPVEYRDYVRVWVNDTEVLPEKWGTTYAVAGQNIYLRVVPQKSGKDIFRAIAMIAIAVVAVAVAPHISAAIIGNGATAASVAIGAGLGVGNFLTAFIAAGISTLGALALNAIIPPPGLSNNAQDNKARLTGTNNSFSPYANIPRVFGKRRLFPLLAARPYSEVQGDDEYLRMALVVGWGPLKISDIKIGDTPITAFDGVEYEVREGWDNDNPLSLFTRTVTEEGFQIELKPFAYSGGYYNQFGYGYDGDYYRYEPDTDTYGASAITSTNDWATRTTALNSVEFSVDIAFPQGLFKFNDKGGKENATVELEVQYRASGSTGAWSNAVWINDYDQGFGTNGKITVTAQDSSAVRRSGRAKLPSAGQYDIRVRRTTANSGDKYVDLTWWNALRSIRADYPVLQKGVSLIALRIKASGQLNGAPATINCIAESYLPVWNGSTWSYALSSNPAWAYCDILRRRGGETFIDDSRIDLTTIKAWADACAANAPNAAEPRWTFNGVIEGGSVFENLKLIAGNARANYIMRDGKHSVVRDVTQTVPVQHISPRNSWGYSGSRMFMEYPHALRVKFPNKDMGYQEDERVVYFDGYNSSNATKFETLELQGCTSAAQAYREGRYHMAVARLRPEEHTVNMDIEALRCTIGDLVRFQHDAVSIGIAAARVKSLTVNGSGYVTTLTLDEDLFFESGKNYVIRGRKADGSSVLISLANPGTGFASTVTPQTAPLSSACPDVGDLVLFGESSTESAPMLVKKIEPSEEFVVSVTMVNYDDGIYTADTGTIPPFNSYMTKQSLPDAGTLPPVYISVIRSDDSAILINADGTIIQQLFVQLQQPQSSTERVDFFEVQWRPTNSPGWQTQRIERAQPFTYLSPVVEGKGYELRSRGVSNTGNATEWSPVVTHTVKGKNAPPGVPTGFSAVAIPGGIRLSWANPLDDDLWLVEAWENTTNSLASATKIVEVAGTYTNRLGLSASSGVRYYWLRAVDTSGNFSEYVGPVSATALNKGLSINLSNDAVSLAADTAGTVSSFATAEGTLTVFDADTDVTATATLSAVAVNCTGTINTAANTPVNGQPKGYYRVTAMSADNARLTIAAAFNGQSISKDFTLAKARAGAAGSNGTNGTNGINGTPGTNVAQVYAYKRAASAPTDNPGVVVFDFPSGTISTTTLANGWSKTIPAGTNPLYIIVASATSTGTTDSIAANEWGTPVLFVQNGEDGANGTNGTNGLSVATVFLYRRTTTSTPPTVADAGNTTYTFANGTVTGQPSGWSATIPSSGGGYLWSIQATASAAAATDTISNAEWSTPVLVAQDGAAGANASVLTLTATAQTFTYDGTGTASPGGQTVTFTANLQSLTGTATWTATGYDANGTSLGSITLGGSGNTRTMNLTQFGAAQYAVVTASLSGYSDTTTIVRLRAGANGTNGADGADGVDAIVGFLTNENTTFAANSSGVVTDFSAATGVFKVFQGLTDRTTESAFAVITETGCDVSINAATGAYTVASMSADTATATLQATYSGATIQKVLTLSKSRAGANGSNGSNGTNGANAVNIVLTKAVANVFAYADGSVPSFAGIDTQVTVFDGATDVTSAATLSIIGNSCTATINTASGTPVSGQPKGYVRVTAMSADNASATITVVYGGNTYTATFTVSKIKTGYEIVSSLPTSNLFEGRVVFLTTDDKLYRYTGAAWTRQVDGADIAANSIEANSLKVGSITAAYLNVTSLSAITGNIGTLTAGTVRNASDTFRIDVTNGRTITQVGSYMKVTGAPFGSSNQFIEWYGPQQASLSLCTESNAVYYLKTNGQAYFGGTLSSGILKNSAQTTSTANNASVVVGPFLTNGGAKSVVMSYNYNRSYSCNSNTGSITGTGSAIIVLERSLDGGGTWTTIGTLTATETERNVLVDGEPGVPDQVRYGLGGSITVTDNSGATTNMALRGRLTTISLPSLGGSGITGQIISQSIAVISTE